MVKRGVKRVAGAAPRAAARNGWSKAPLQRPAPPAHGRPGGGGDLEFQLLDIDYTRLGPRGFADRDLDDYVILNPKP